MRLFRNVTAMLMAALLSAAIPFAPAHAALSYSTAIANARLDAVEATCGTSPILLVRTGAPPATVADSSTGTVVATASLPSDWMGPASGRSKTKLGTWEDPSADASGTAGHFEFRTSGGVTVCMRGTISATGGGGDMTVDSVSFTAGQAFSVSAFQLNAAN